MHQSHETVGGSRQFDPALDSDADAEWSGLMMDAERDNCGPRILFPFVGDTVGGSHISASQLIQHLPKFGFRPIVGLHEEGALATYLDKRGIEFVKLPSVRSPVARNALWQASQVFANTRRLRAFLQKYRIDVVHTNDRLMHVTWGWPTFRQGRRHIWHERTSVRSRRVGIYARLSSAMVAISEYTRASFPGPMGAHASVVPNPVDVRTTDRLLLEARDAIHADCGSFDNPAIVLWVGSWSAQKRPLAMVDIAARLVSTSSAPVCFAMIGRHSETDRREFDALLKLSGLAEYFVIRQFEDPIEPIIAAADVLVATAVQEGLGRTLIEAMQLETPVVATKDGGHREVITDGIDGDLVDANDFEGFAKKIHALLTDSVLHERYVRNSSDRARDRFSVESHTMRIAELYRRVLA